MIDIFGYQIDTALFWTIVGVALTAIGIIVTLMIRVRLRKKDEERMRRTEEEVRKAKEEAIAAKDEARKAKEKAELANKNIENIERHFNIPIYADGLPSADPPVFDPFLEGTKLMAEYKWDDAVSEFQKAMKEAKATQLVALFNLIGLCYYNSGRPSLALENYEKSLGLAQQLVDKEGKGEALGNIGLIYQDKGDLEQALKYLEETLKIDKEIGFKEDEANQLSNIGLIYRAKGDLDQALKYHQEALKIDKEIGFRQGKASDLGSIGLIYQAKGDLNQALKYYNEALKILEEIGMPEEIEKTKRNIERISQQMKQMKK